MMYQYRKYPQVDVIGAMLWAFNVQGPVLLAALAFGPAVGGEFSLAFKALATPATLGAYSLSRVYHREAAARRADPDQLSRLFASCLRRGLLFSGVLCGAAALVSPRAFPPIFGAEWQRAGVLCSMIAPLLAAQILTTILSPTFDVLQRQERRLYQEVVTGLALIAGLGLGWALGWTPAGAVLSMSLAGSLGHAYSIFSAWREIRHLGGAASCSAPPTSLRRAA
jgi:O-antigen/teichoic acid export membrane protein